MAKAVAPRSECMGEHWAIEAGIPSSSWLLPPSKPTVAMQCRKAGALARFKNMIKPTNLILSEISLSTQRKNGLC